MKRLASITMLSLMVLLSSCNCYKKMQKGINEVGISCTPELLTLKGSSIVAKIDVKFEEGYFNKKAILKITPVLVFEDGEILGSAKFVQGEKVKDNYTVIAKDGGSYTQTVTFPYKENLNLSTLELRVETMCAGSDEIEVTSVIPVASGVSATQNLAINTMGLQFMKDNFKRVHTISNSADLFYLINSSQVRSAQLSSEQVLMFENFVKENSGKDRVTLGNVYSKGYASPDGPVKFNDELAKKRSKAGEVAVSKQLKSVSDVKYDMSSYGEDWAGFKALVEASNIEDKDIILQVLSMYNSPAERDAQIQNMSEVFDVLKVEVLPKLRRTLLTVTADVEGYTDEELEAAVINNIQVLDLEELLYAGTLVKSNKTKIKVYQAATKFNDARAFNNLGVVLAKGGDVASAKVALQRAAAIKSSKQIQNNLGIIALMENNMSVAKELLSKGNATSKSLLALKEGDYAAAVKGLKGYNLAVAQVCNDNLSAANKTLVKCNAGGYEAYLKAIICMKEADSKGAIANLKSAIKKDKKFADMAEKNVDFAKLFGTTEFLAL